LEEYRKKWGQMAEASEEGLGSKWAVVPMIVVV